jgi:hypothetical protein
MTRNDDHAASRRAARCLADETDLEGPLEIVGLEAPSGSGYSNATLMFDAVDRHGRRTGLVARVHQTGLTLYPPVGLNRHRYAWSGHDERNDRSQTDRSLILSSTWFEILRCLRSLSIAPAPAKAVGDAHRARALLPESRSAS